MIFKCITSVNAPDFYRYLLNEISVLNIKASHPFIASDPLLNQLTVDEENRILKYSILSLGSFNEREQAMEIVRGLVPILKGSNPAVRGAALFSIFCQIQLMNDNEANMCLWEILPLFADPNPHIRRVFVSYISKSLNFTDKLIRFLPKHPDDSYASQAL